MSVEIKELMGEIEKSMHALERLGSLYDQASNGLTAKDKTLEKAVFLSEIMSNYYTCLETVFFRISQYFENSLPKDHWHAELLRKMTLRIPDIREPVISDESALLLDELRKFRHFKRYYFNMDYDWDRLEYLRKKFERIRILCPGDMARFMAFIERLDGAA